MKFKEVPGQGSRGSRGFGAGSPPLRKPRLPRPARRPPVQSPAASAGSLSPRREPPAAGAGGVRKGSGTRRKARLEFHPICLVLDFGLTLPSLSTPAVCPEATRTPSGWTARLSGGGDALGKGVGLSRPPRTRPPCLESPPAPPHPPRPCSCQGHRPHAYSCPLPGPGPLTIERSPCGPGNVSGRHLQGPLGLPRAGTAPPHRQ